MWVHVLCDDESKSTDDSKIKKTPVAAEGNASNVKSWYIHAENLCTHACVHSREDRMPIRLCDSAFI